MQTTAPSPLCSPALSPCSSPINVTVLSQRSSPINGLLTTVPVAAAASAAAAAAAAVAMLNNPLDPHSHPSIGMSPLSNASSSSSSSSLGSPVQATSALSPDEGKPLAFKLNLLDKSPKVSNFSIDAIMSRDADQQQRFKNGKSHSSTYQAELERHLPKRRVLINSKTEAFDCLYSKSKFKVHLHCATGLHW